MAYSPALYPNVIKIETLSLADRKYYLTTLGDVTLELQQQIIASNGINTGSRQAMGLMSASDIGTFSKVSYTSDWKESADKGLFTNALVQNLPSLATGVGPNATALAGRLANILKVGGGDSKSKGYADRLANISENIGTGPQTVKRFEKFSVDIANTFSMNFYMPDQFDLATKSIDDLLYMMAPIPINVAQVTKENVNIGDVAAIMGNKLSSGALAFFEGAGAAITSGGNLGAFSDKLLNNEGLSKIVLNYAKFNAQFFETLGLDYHIDPLPVSIQFGHIAYVEPLVITSVSISSSKERFNYIVNGKYVQVPIKVEVKISTVPWLNVPPSKSKNSFFGGKLQPYSAYSTLRKQLKSGVAINTTFGEQVINNSLVSQNLDGGLAQEDQVGPALGVEESINPTNGTNSPQNGNSPAPQQQQLQL